ncbi:MAG: sigma-70 family RNA polymerase sigma factor [Patescibacteria group bacterium]
MLDGEDKLIAQAIRGKASAFGSLYDYYQPKIYRFVLIKVGRREDAEDLTHQVFLAALESMKSYKDMGYPFSSWLYRIARNQVIDFYRTNKKEASIEETEPDFFVAPAIAHFGVEGKMEMEKVQLAIQKLKPEYQDVVIMRFVEDLPIKEVADSLGKSEGAVKLLQHRAIRELKKILVQA